MRKGAVLSSVLVEVQLQEGGRLLVEADRADLEDQDLVLAAPEPGKIAARAGKTFEQALDEIKPAMTSMMAWLERLAPSESTVTFGLKIGGEAGLILAKGTAEVNFAVTLTWKK